METKYTVNEVGLEILREFLPSGYPSLCRKLDICEICNFHVVFVVPVVMVSAYE